MSTALLRIGDIARLLGVTTKTVRHYHKLGLIPEPERSESGYRLYSPADLFVLQRIRRLQSLGLSLRQIKFIFEADDPDRLLRTTLDQLQQEIRGQIKRLKHRQAKIRKALAEDVSLTQLTLLQGESPTFKLLKKNAEKFFAAVPPETIQLDRLIFAQVDALNWPRDHTETFSQIANYFQENPEIEMALITFGKIFTQVAELPTDSPKISQLAEEAAQTILGKHLAAVKNLSVVDPSPMLTSVFDQIVITSVNEVLTPSQRVFFEHFRKLTIK